MALYALRDSLGRMAMRRVGPALNVKNKVVKMASPCVIQVAHITAPAHQYEKVPKPKPWPYDRKKFRTFHQLFDSTSARLDENSKIIVVEGNVGVGKTAFAQKLAEELGFYYLRDVNMSDIYFDPFVGVDLRELNFLMPQEETLPDVEDFLSHPEKRRGGILQLQMLRAKYFMYSKALSHVLNTGQGVVCDRSVWGDEAFAAAMKRCNHISAKGYKYYQMTKRNTVCELWKPHLTILLDAPVSYCQQKIKERNIPYEVNSSVLTGDFLSTIDTYFKSNLLPEMKKYSEVLQYDATNLENLEIVVEDIERLELEDNPVHEMKFEEWKGHNEDDWSFYRRKFSSPAELQKYWMLPMPWDAPEMMPGVEEQERLKILKDTYPKTQYSSGFNYKEGDSIFKILFNFSFPNTSPHPVGPNTGVTRKD